MMLPALAAFAMSGCDREWNEWGTDPSQDGLFRPLTFEQSRVDATAVEISYGQVPTATHYLFEFSKDNLEFNEIIRQDTVLRDTLTVFAENSNPIKVLFHTLFKGLEGETTYSVRMKAWDEDTGLECAWSSFSFVTPGEQLFTGASTGMQEVTLNWTPGEQADRIKLYIADKSTETGYAELQDYEISAEEVETGSKTITGLEIGTSYMAEIYLGERRRGSTTFRTKGLAGSTMVELAPEDDLAAKLTAEVEAGHSNLTVTLSGETPYAFSSNIVLPDGIDNITFTGEGETKPTMQIKKIEFSGKVNAITFENLKVDGLSSNDNVFQPGDPEKTFESLYITGCEICNYKRTIVMFNHNDLNVNTVSIENSIITNINENYGIVCMNKKAANISNVSITNSTLVNCGQILRGQDGLKSVTLNGLTVYNSVHLGSNNWLRFDAQPAAKCEMTNIVIGGTATIQTNARYDYLDFSTCYITSDMTQVESKPLTGINTLTISSEELFTDPANGDFSFKSNFAGRDKAGDPRWRQ